MSIRIDVTRTKFYQELSEECRKEYFDLSRNKILPCIDNVYYTCFINHDKNNNIWMQPIFDEMQVAKQLAQEKHDSVVFGQLQLTPYGFNIYKYCLSEPDLYDIFVTDYLPNDDTPRVLVQLRAYGLWIYGVEKMVTDSFRQVQALFDSYAYDQIDFQISKCRENRIDYCFHTNIIKNPYKEFAEDKLERSCHTIFNNYGIVGHIEKAKTSDKNISFVKDYISFGKRKANNIFVRIYNKGLEVVQLAYKSFFFEVWQQQGLINKYDKYCYEYAYEKKDFDAIHRARLQFYLEHGAHADLKEEILKELNKNKSPLEYKELADSLMPEVTTVLNIEFETKRRFYYYSDKFIDDQLKNTTSCVQPLQRLFKILDNRHLFLDYLTSKTLSFRKSDGSYADWWQRLRNTKLDTVKTDDKLVRAYSKDLDRNIVMKRAVNAVATSALYNGLDDYDLKADMTDLLSNINDNTIAGYIKNKASKKKRLKNLL